MFDGTQNGDKVWFPAGFTYIAPSGGWKIQRSLEIYGDGPGGLESATGTVLKPYSGSPPSGGGNDVIVLDPSVGRLQNIHIHDLAITGLTGSSRTGRSAIRFTPLTNKKLANLQLNRLAIADMNGDGISLVGASDSHVAGVNIADVEVRGCAGHGIVFNQSYQVCLIRARFAGNGGSGLYATESGVTLYVCAFDTNSGNDQAYLKDCYLARVDACSFKNFAMRGVQFLNCGGTGPIGGCLFTRDTFSASTIGIEIGSSTVLTDGAMLVLANRFQRIGTGVYLNDTALGCIVLPQHFDAAGGTPSTPVRFPTSVAADNASTFALPSAAGPTNRPSGLLVPKLTADPSADNQAGMLYFQKTTSLNRLRTFLPGSPTAWHEVLLTDPPTPITDLSILSVVGRTTLVVNWSAPSALGWPGGVEQYAIRYSTAPITEANFDSALVPANPPPTPSAPGTQECFKVSGPTGQPLSVCTTYYVAIKAKCAGAGYSGLSNVPSRKTKCSGSGEVDCPS